MDSSEYDLVIVGTGAAATTVAEEVRAGGWSVAVIDSRPYGGTCALRGCDPKKVLVSAARAVNAHCLLSGTGVFGEASIAWPVLMRFKRSFTDPVPEQRENLFAGKGIARLHGVARFVGRGRIDIAGQQVVARHVVLANGARPIPLNIPGSDHVATSEDFMALDALPRRIFMIGGGYIAAEFSHLAACAGAKITVAQRADRMLTLFDADLVAMLMQRFRELGIDVRTDTSVTGVERRGDIYVVHMQSEQGTATEEADLVVHAAGRAPDFDTLNLPAAGIACDEKGRPRLNKYLQSISDPTVYAAGDAAGAGPPLTPVAGLDGEVVAANLLHGNTRRPDYRGIPSVAFSMPPIAAVGMNEEQARKAGLSFRVNHADASGWATARRVGEKVYAYKVLVENDSNRILGAHLVGPDADEVINLFALAIRHGLSAEALKNSLFSYPTGSSDIRYML